MMMKSCFASVLALFLWSGSVRVEAVERDMTVVTVVGAAGAEQYEQEFVKLAKSWRQACEDAGVRLVEVGGDQAADGKGDRQRLKQVLASEIERGSSSLWLVLIGHGTFDGRETKFNVRGADFTEKDLAQWLQTYKGELVVVNTASSSAPFIKALSGKDRVVITATKSAHEIFYPRFGGYFASAIGGLEAADLDNDEQVSLLEAFLYAGHEVKAFYEKEGRIATEHALLDDNGDQQAVRMEGFVGVLAARSKDKKARENPDGERAHQIHLVPNPLEALMPEDLRRKRDALELKVKALRRQKGEMDEEPYYEALEKLLLEIARIYETVEAAQD
ncbi:MAG: hypothetical protein QM496_14120 [Verrucomicrobiota bacterium]